MVIPAGKEAGALLEIEATAQLSLAVGEPSSVEERETGAEVTVFVTLGGAVKVRVMTRGLVEEPAPPLLDSLTVTEGVEQLSVAIARPALAAGTSLRH